VDSVVLAEALEEQVATVSIYPIPECRAMAQVPVVAESVVL
jgi:hypothetical protein